MSTNNECTADLGAPPCECNSCVEHEADLRKWARSQRFEPYTENEIRDCYSDPTEASKRNILLARCGGTD